MTPSELRDYVTVMRETGVQQLRVGRDVIVLGAAPNSVKDPAPVTKAPAPIGPDGREMSEHDQILFGHQFEDPGATR